jgi:hypothetical protein
MGIVGSDNKINKVSIEKVENKRIELKNNNHTLNKNKIIKLK